MDSLTPEAQAQWPHCAIIAVLCLLVYGWSLGYGFVWDDVAFIQEGRLIQSLRNIPAMFASNLWEGAGQSSSYYRPIPQVLSSLDFHFWNRNPFGYHLTNVLLHIIACLFVYLLATRLTGAALRGFCAALFFAVHPAHAETVAWVGARTEMLPAIFMFAALYAHLRFRDGDGRAWLCAGLFGFWCALLSKEMAVTLPALVFLSGLVRGDRIKQSLAWGGLYGILLVPYFAIRTAVLGRIGMGGGESLLARFATALDLYARYVRELLFPFKAKACYVVATKSSILAPEVITAAVILFLLASLVLVLWRRDKIAAFGMIWVIVTLLPVSGLPAIIKPFAMANRYLYIPSWGLALAASCLWLRFRPAASAPALTRLWIAGGGVLIIVMGVVTATRLHYWSNDREFYTKCVEDAPDYGVAVGNLGGILLKERRLDEAGSHLERAYSLDPKNLNVLNNLAYLLMLKGELARAGELLGTAVAIRPDHYLTRFNLATLYVRLGKPAEAESEFIEASRIAPHRAEPYLRLGNLSLERHDFDGAIIHFSAALERTPLNKSGVFAGLGAAYAAKGMLDKAEYAYAQAVELNPDDPSLRESLRDVRLRSRAAGEKRISHPQK